MGHNSAGSRLHRTGAHDPEPTVDHVNPFVHTHLYIRTLAADNTVSHVWRGEGKHRCNSTSWLRMDRL